MMTLTRREHNAIPSRSYCCAYGRLDGSRFRLDERLCILSHTDSYCHTVCYICYINLSPNPVSSCDAFSHFAPVPFACSEDDMVLDRSV